MKRTLVIGRCWKFIDFLIPTVDSIIDYNDNVDLIILDSLSSRSDNIISYCQKLLKLGDIRAYVTTDNNYFGNIWHVNQYLIDIVKEYEYISLTDMDLKIVNPTHNWLDKMCGILERNDYIGAVSGDFEPMPPISDSFHFAKDHPESKADGEDFWDMLTDGWFFTMRARDFLDFIQTGGRVGQFGPGMHGYTEYCLQNDKKIGRTNVIFYHYGWLRSTEEWSSAYKETGINFGDKIDSDNNLYQSIQGNWDQNIQVPTRESFTIFQ